MKIFFCLLFIGAYQSSLAQQLTTPNNPILFQRVPWGFVSQLPRSPAKTQGDYFYSEAWYTGNIYLASNEQIEAVTMRLNLKDNSIEIKLDNEIKILSGKQVKFLEWMNEDGYKERLINAADYALESGKVRGFFAVLIDGNFKLFRQTKAEVKQGSYNVALDVGTPDNVIIKTHSYLVCRGGQLMELPSGRKKIIRDFSSHYDIDISTTVKQLDFHPKEESDLIRLVQALNEKYPLNKD
jgi:hypothetical protein